MTANRFGLTPAQIEAKRRGLPRGVTYRERTDAFRVQLSGHVEKTFRDKREAIAYFAELKSGRAAQAPQPKRKSGDTLTVERYAMTYIDERADLKSGTRRSYRGMVSSHIVGTVFGRMLLADVQRRDVNGFLIWLARQHGTGTGRPLSYSRVDAVRNFLSGMLKHAREDQLAQLFTLPKTPKHGESGTPLVETAETIVPTDREIDLLFGALAGEQHEALYWLLRLTGMRIGEALALQRQHLQLGDAPTIDIRGTLDERTRSIGSPKTKRSKRSIRIPAELAKILREHLAAQDQLAGPKPIERFVFTTLDGQRPIWADNVRRAFLRLQRQTGIVSGEQDRRADGAPALTPHDLRHHFVTQLIAAGMSTAQIAQYVGDTERQIAKTYAHYIERTSTDIAAATAGILRRA